MGNRLGPAHPWIGLIAGPVAAVVSFVAAYFVDPLNFGDRAPLAALPAFLFAVVVLLITQNFAAYRELERAANQSRELYEAVKGYLHVTKVGSPEHALRYVMSRLPILQEVRNTSFNVRGHTDRAQDMFYETDLYGEFTGAIAKWAGNGLRWKDLGDSFAVDRFRTIFHRTERARGGSHYQYRLIAHTEPQLNFLLLGYPDGTSEVMFNWDFRNFGQDPTVLLSRDREIVQMFTVQFEHLWTRASRDHDIQDLTHG